MKSRRILRSEAEEPLDPGATTVPGNRPHPAPLASCTLRWMARVAALVTGVATCVIGVCVYVIDVGDRAVESMPERERQ
jgi:hypothetical protein